MRGFKAIWQAFSSKNVESTSMDEKAVEELFNELYANHNKKKRMQDYIHELSQKIHEVKQFSALDEKDIEQLTQLAQRAKDIDERKQNLRGRLITNNAALARLAQYEEDLPELLQEMQEVEKRKKQTESHIYYLQDEKEDLIDERENLLAGYRFLKVFSVAMLLVIAVGLLVAFAMLQILREAIWFYLTGAGIALIFIMFAVLFTKDRLDGELVKNGILQQKAAKYLNKAKIRYFNERQYLDFQYQKLGVDSVAKLEMYYNRYMKNKNNEKTYLQMNRTLNEIEEDMLFILKNKGIQIDYTDNLVDWALNPRKLGEAKILEAELQKTKDQMAGFDTYHKQLLEEVEALKNDEALKLTVEKELKAYNAQVALDKSEKGA